VELVVALPEKVVFLERGLVDFLYSSIGVADGISVALARETARTPVP